MEDQNSNDTSPYNSYYDNSIVITIPIEYYIVFWIITSIFLPLAVLAIYSLSSLVRDDQVASIFVINLLISDLIQICSKVVMSYGQRKFYLVFMFIYHSSLGASVGFMACVSLERYVVIAWPLWYRFRRSINVSVVVCVVVWVLPLASEGLLFLVPSVILEQVMSSIFFLLPFPVPIFSLVGTFKALSAAISISSEEKLRIVRLLILVLLNYTLLFLPRIIHLITLSRDYIVTVVSDCLNFFSPLADVFLYVFMRKGAVDKLLASLCCCCRMEAQQE